MNLTVFFTVPEYRQDLHTVIPLDHPKHSILAFLSGVVIPGKILDHFLRF